MQAIEWTTQRRNRKSSRSPKQLTLDNIPETKAIKSDAGSCKKQVTIVEVKSFTREDELALKISFKLLPSKTSFSKVKSDLWFDGQQISTISVSIPQGPLATDEFELTPVLDMRGIPAGLHTIKIEMYELWSSGEKLSQTTKEVIVEYVPQTRESRLIKVPIAKSIAGNDLAVSSESENEIYKQIEKTAREELISKRDEW